MPKSVSYLLAAVILTAGMTMFQSCNRDYSPKPRSYFRIDFPEKEYKQFISEDCPYGFLYPDYATIHPDTAYDTEPCWKHIYYEPFDAYLHLSYKPVQSFENFHELREDARTFVYEHTVKASDIKQHQMTTGGNTLGVLFMIDGAAASTLQFYATDSVRHYLRGALYFNAPTNRDSLDPVIDYLEEDIRVLMETIEWN